jgi:hypothetical protein
VPAPRRPPPPSLPAWLLPGAPRRCHEDATQPPDPSHTSPWPLTPRPLTPTPAERSRRRRRAPPWPQPLPRLVDALRGSASTPSSSPSSRAPPEALQRRPRHRLQPLAAGELFGDSRAPASPRPRRCLCWICREPLPLSPLSPCSSAPSSHRGHRSRQLLAAGHVATATTAMQACVRAHRCTQRTPRSRAHPPDLHAVLRSPVSVHARTLAAAKEVAAVSSGHPSCCCLTLWMRLTPRNP